MTPRTASAQSKRRSAAKKPYTSPRVREFGDVRRLTQTSPIFNGPTDGGSGVTVYGS